MVRRKLPPESVRGELKRRLRTGDIVDLNEMVAVGSRSLKQYRDAISGLRTHEGWGIGAIGQGRYVLEHDPEGSPPAAPGGETPQKRRENPSPPAPKQRRRSAAERAQAAPPLGCRLQVVGLGLDKARVLVILSDGKQEWSMHFDTAPPPAWAEEGGE